MARKPVVVLDTNVFVSGLLSPSGVPGLILARFRSGHFDIATSKDQIREIRNDLPPSYYRQLPKLVDGPFKGYPRIFEIAWAFVAHTDSRFEAEMLRRTSRLRSRGFNRVFAVRSC